MSIEQHFAPSYAEARAKFLAACDRHGLAVQSHTHPLLGRDGEALAMDVARRGSADAKSLLIISSACHGVEGFCGSGVQNALLDHSGLLQQQANSGVAVLLVHALNPYGFSWWRRVTQENVDLNRNWHDFSQPLPDNPGYDEMAHLLVPSAWPPSADNEAALQVLAQRMGQQASRAAVSSGQYTHPEGLFFGGHRPTWSHQTLRHVLHDHGTRCTRLGWIDLHTGLGPAGHGERIFADRNDAVSLARAKHWWGKEVTSIYDGTSSSAQLSGLMFNVAYEACAQAEITGIAMEYGTLPSEQVLLALRAEQWLYNHPEAPAEQQQAIKQQFRDAFYTDTPTWKQQVVAQGLQAVQQALAALAD